MLRSLLVTHQLEGSEPWGHEDRYFALSAVVASRSMPRDVSSNASRWAKALESATPGTRDAVESAYRRWNSVIRDALRIETALRLSVGEDIQSVPVKIVDGMPAPFAEALRGLEGLEWLLLNRTALEAAITGARFLEASLPGARAQWGEEAGLADVDDIRAVHATAYSWLRRLNQLNALERLAGIREDVLGAYYFRIPEIRLHWQVIGITARLLGVSTEALTIVVLAHELAHAYTHLGLDIDNERWETDRFARSDLHVVEGLAQYYTETICSRLEPRMPSALAAYHALLQHQSAPYQAQLSWTEGGRRSSEIIRVSMLEFRSKGLESHADFTSAVNRYRVGVRGR
jgi:hypothetical protein